MMRERMTAVAASSSPAATSPSSLSSSASLLLEPHARASADAAGAGSRAGSSAGRDSALSSSLSCLSWLTTLNVNNLGPLSPASYASSQHSSSSDDDETDDILSVDWQSDASRKPPFAYATLIYMALRESDCPKLALAEIYDYISDNFAYYRYADPGWKNSIRHNLSQERCFIKMERDSTEKGKGGYWALNPDFTDFDYIANKRRRKFKNRNTSVPLNGRRKKSSSDKGHALRGSAGSRPSSSQGGKRRRVPRAQMCTPPSSYDLDQLHWASSPDSHQDGSLLGASAFVLREHNAQPSPQSAIFTDPEAMAEHLRTTIVANDAGFGSLDVSMNGTSGLRLGSRRASGIFAGVQLPSPLALGGASIGGAPAAGDGMAVDELALHGRRCQLHLAPDSASLDDDKLGLSFCFKLMDVERDPSMVPSFDFDGEQCVDSGSAAAAASSEGKTANGADMEELGSPWSLSQMLQWSPAERSRTTAAAAAAAAAGSGPLCNDSMLLGLSQSASDLHGMLRTPRMRSPLDSMLAPDAAAASPLATTVAPSTAAEAGEAAAARAPPAGGPGVAVDQEADVDVGKPMPLDWL